MDGAGAGAADSGSTELAIAPLGAALADNGEAGDASEGVGSRDRSEVKGERAEKPERTNRQRSPLRGFSAALLPKDGSASLTIPLALVALLVLGGGVLSADTPAPADRELRGLPLIFCPLTDKSEAIRLCL